MIHIITDEKLVSDLEKIIEDKKYPLAFVRLSSDKKRLSIVFFNHKENFLDKTSFAMGKNKEGSTTFLVKSHETQEKIQISELEFRSKIEKELKVGIINNCLPKEIKNAKGKPTLEYAERGFMDFSNLCSTNKEFGERCEQIFGIKFDLVSNYPPQIKLLEENKGTYLLVQDCGEKGGFGAIICTKQIQDFIVAHNKALVENRKSNTSYATIAKKLPDSSDSKSEQKEKSTPEPVRSKEEKPKDSKRKSTYYPVPPVNLEPTPATKSKQIK